MIVSQKLVLLGASGSLLFTLGLESSVEAHMVLYGHSHDPYSLSVPPQGQGNANLPIIIPPDEQRKSVWLFSDNATFAATRADTNGQISLFDFTTLAGGPIPHYHTKEDEFVYVLEGEISYQLRDTVFTATPGTFISKPKNVLHAFNNQETTPARHLEFVIPSGIEDFFTTLGQPGTPTSPPPLQTPDSADLGRVSNTFNQFGIKTPDSLIIAPDQYNLTKEGIPEVKIYRPGEVEGEISATIALSYESAEGFDNQSQTEIPVTFADGERIKTVPIPLTDIGENRKVTLTLTKPTNGTSVGLLQNKAVLTTGENNTYTLTNGYTPDDFPKLYPDPQRQAFWLGGDNYSFVATGAQTKGLLSLFDVFVPPQSETEPLISSPVDQAFYVLDGNVTFQLEDRLFTAPPDTFVYLPEGNSYALKNSGAESAQTLLFSTLPGLENFIAETGIPGDRFSSPSISEPFSGWGLLGIFGWSAAFLWRSRKI
ncbi:MAG: cupin domain-containing protein [Hydrococcus sp. Prado102]|jgi:quercetin dioxygenase-like cupin family protein|nr:cupin domain-containing protein [Hydrococcus sp. Prado102]